MASIVSMKGVAKAYQRGKQRVEVLRGIDLEVERGEFLALMGPSGSGKTTLLNLIGGLDRPDRGELTVGGERLDTLSPGKLTKWRARHLGFIFQFYNLLPVLTAERNVEVPLLLTKLRAKDRQRNGAAALELVGLADRAKHKPGGKTIVMVTHDPRAADHASRRLYVDKGVLGLAPLGAAA